MSQKLEPLFEADKRVDHFFFDPKSLVIYFLKSVQGRKVKFSTKEKLPNILKAKRYANKELQDRLGAKRRRVRTLIKDELANWQKVKESELGGRESMNAVKRSVAHIEEYWGSMLPDEIDRDSCAAWVAAWPTLHPDITQETAIKYFKNFTRYLVEKGLARVVPKIVDPNRPLYMAKRQKKRENILEPGDFKLIYLSAPSWVEALLVLFMYTMASRITETLELRFDVEILLDQNVPVYRWSIGQNKADLWGEHALHPALIEPLKKLREQRRAEGTNRLFPQSRNNQAALKEQQIDWAAWRKRAGILFHWTPHTFRHTCLTILFNDPGNQQALILKLYRVSLKTALETYIKVTQEGRLRMRDVIEVSL